MKLHTLLDLGGSIPTFIHISDGKLHDVNVLDLLTPKPGAFYVMDCGYLDFERASRDQIVEALRGRVGEHHRFMLKLHLEQVAHCKAPSPNQVMASEMGLDMQRFPSDDSLGSWAGMCPRSGESAGKRRSTRIRKGAPWLKTTLIQAAWAAVRTKDSYLWVLFHRIKARRGAMKASVAVAASISRSAYHMLRKRVPYQDLGPAHFDARNKTRTTSRLLKRLKELGIEVLE